MVKATVFEPDAYVVVAAAVAVNEQVPLAPTMIVKGDCEPMRQNVSPTLVTEYEIAPGPEDVAAEGENCLPPPDDAIRLGAVVGSHVTLCCNGVTVIVLFP